MAANKRSQPPPAPPNKAMVRIVARKSDTDNDSVSDETTPPKRSLLLELPGELRNEIYQYILLDIEEQGPRATRMRKRGTTVVVPSSTEQVPLTLHESVETAIRIRPRHLDLTQACRIMRDEFRPLYLAKKYVVVTHDTVHQYLETFAAEGVGNIGVAESPFEDPVIELLPIFVPTSPLLKIRLDYRAVGDGTVLKFMSTFLETVYILNRKRDLFRTLVEVGMLKSINIQEVKMLDYEGYEIPLITLRLVDLKPGNDARLLGAQYDLHMMDCTRGHEGVRVDYDFVYDTKNAHDRVEGEDDDEAIEFCRQ